MIRLVNLAIERKGAYLAGNALFEEPGHLRDHVFRPRRYVRLLWCCERDAAPTPHLALELWGVEEPRRCEQQLSAQHWCDALGKDITRLLLAELDRRNLLGALLHG